jgi:YidC/Oxa1 family membrane protein insertase
MQQDNESQKNLMLAIALSLAVLLGWQYFYAGPKLKDEQERRQRASASQQPLPGQPAAQSGATTTPGAPVTAPVSGAPAATPGAATTTTLLSREETLKASPRIAIATPSLIGSINLRGARIDDVAFQNYREEAKPGSPNIVFFAPAGTAKAYFAEYGWTPAAGQNVAVPNKDTIWKADSAGPMTSAKPIVLSHDNGKGVTFRRTISVDDKFMFAIKDDVENKSGADITLVPYARIFRLGTPKVEGFIILHEGLIGFLGSKAGLQEIVYSDLAKEAEANHKEKRPAEAVKSFADNKGGWLGITDKYWGASLIPPQDQTYLARMMGFKKTDLQEEAHQADYVLNPMTVPTNATASITSHLFAGAKQAAIIDSYGEKLGITKFDMMVDWGWFYFITKPLYKLMTWLYNALGNFGLAILAVTVLVKLAFFPLASKSYESMAKMKKLQPEMERLRVQYKDDKAAQQQELMKLYQKEKINPAAGCLPIVLQIPVFFALYKVLFIGIDMRHAPFYGWIKDLSVPDPTSIFNLFGLIPYAMPEFLQVGVWPIVMGITMWIQMQLNPQQPDPIQQKIFNWMPVMFTFLLASFPVGLVIYWAWSNVLSLLQQYYIMHKNGADIHLWKNIGIDKWLNKTADKK